MNYFRIFIVSPFGGGTIFNAKEIYNIQSNTTDLVFNFNFKILLRL